ncbi:hypothetical protein D3C80_1247910 [compost metagenome]
MDLVIHRNHCRLDHHRVVYGRRRRCRTFSRSFHLRILLGNCRPRPDVRDHARPRQYRPLGSCNHDPCCDTGIEADGFAGQHGAGRLGCCPPDRAWNWHLQLRADQAAAHPSNHRDPIDELPDPVDRHLEQSRPAREAARSSGTVHHLICFWHSECCNRGITLVRHRLVAS